MNEGASEQRGFALIVLLGVIGVGSVGLLLAVQAFVPTLRERNQTAGDNLEVVASAARIAYRRNGAFPADLDALAVAAGLAVDGNWRRDPYGSGNELDYGSVAGGVRIRSRGVDGVLGSGDDVQCDIGAETQLRSRQRTRLRMLRAVLLRSPFRFDGGMTPSEALQMQTSTRSYAMALRRWWAADIVERALLTTEMTTHAASIEALSLAYGLPAIPTSVTGAGGLMSQLGLPDARAYDGAGNPLISHPVLGLVAVGADGVGGTDDDM